MDLDLLHTCQHAASDNLQASFLHLLGQLVLTKHAEPKSELRFGCIHLHSEQQQPSTRHWHSTCCVLPQVLLMGQPVGPPPAAATKHEPVLQTVQCTAQQVLSGGTTQYAFPFLTAAEDSRVWQSIYRTVQQVLLKGLADGAQEVRLAAVSAMTLLVPYSRDPSETNLFKQLVPAALKVSDSQPTAGWPQLHWPQPCPWCWLSCMLSMRACLPTACSRQVSLSWQWPAIPRSPRYELPASPEHLEGVRCWSVAALHWGQRKVYAAATAVCVHVLQYQQQGLHCSQQPPQHWHAVKSAEHLASLTHLLSSARGSQGAAL